ncbi:phosphate signaling complex protein PhoU [Natronorubrum thiooxidans]|uniref:Phosphate-specific transport system accessory protein PhoU n=1 Tax=Natronorubrum thiooxidans TaxID=308853 RepID=A0A1N7CM98_9EURY|nr:phosphate signaling complex protein PhoU [Natronorubrum thiooxidans]SIR64719.1 phosphate transport system protein [Natronorubrum thiooxidans]
MSRTEFQQQLEQLRRDVYEMGTLVCQRLRQALEAFETNDDSLAADVITGDGEINERYLELEQDCVELFALQQPVAGDLRFVASSFKILTDLERIGDLAVNLGEYTRQTEYRRYSDIDIAYIGEQTIDMVERAMAAYKRSDVTSAREIAAADDDIDTLCEGASELVVRDLLEIETGVELTENTDTLLEDVSRMLLTIRDLERVGDHAVNIAARTLYMVDHDDELIY